MPTKTKKPGRPRRLKIPQKTQTILNMNFFITEEVTPFGTTTLHFGEKSDNSNYDLVEITSDEEEGKK